MVVDEFITGAAVDLANVSAAISALPGISGLIKIGKVAGVVVIVYILFLILKGVLQIRVSFRSKKILQNVEEINQKIDLLVKGNLKKSKKIKSMKK